MIQPGVEWILKGFKDSLMHFMNIPLDDIIESALQEEGKLLNAVPDDEESSYMVIATMLENEVAFVKSIAKLITGIQV